eukprot:sb/3466195/
MLINFNPKGTAYAVMVMVDLYSDDCIDLGVDSSEDTEDASETDQRPAEEGPPIVTEIKTEEKTSSVHEKVHNLRDLLRQLQSGTLPGYLSRLAKLEAQHKERIQKCHVDKEIELQMIDEKFQRESKRLKDDFDHKKVTLKENLLSSLEEKKKMIEAEHNAAELNGAPLDNFENRPSFTRKLRRRQNDPDKDDGKSNKPPSPAINFLLSDAEIEEDLLQSVFEEFYNKSNSRYILIRLSFVNSSSPRQILPPHKAERLRERKANLSFCEETEHRERPVTDIKVEDGRLYYERKWYGRYQNVFVESREQGKLPAVIQSICSSDIVVKKITDMTKLKITISQLQKGKFTLKRRS